MRFRIFKEIAGHAELSCQELVERFTLSQPTISHHLKVLSQAGLLSVRKRGSFHMYSARREVLDEHLRQLGEVIAAPGVAPRRERST
jgi:ArsR family transcriptional regulator